MIDVKKIGPWSRVGKLLASAPRRMQAAFDKALLQEGQFLRTKIVEGIREQAPGGRAFAPLAPTTLAIRQFRGFRGTKALLVQGDLRNSITVVKDGDRVLVGVLRTARSRDGKSLVDIAALQEHGSRPIVIHQRPPEHRHRDRPDPPAPLPGSRLRDPRTAGADLAAFPRARRGAAERRCRPHLRCSVVAARSRLQGARVPTG
jgi:hypothetical protein